MKPLFAIDLTNDKKNEVINGREFISKSASEQSVDILEDNQEGLKQTVKKSQLPFWLALIKYFSGVIAFLVFANVLINAPEIGFTQILRNAIELIIVAIVCGILWAILFVYSRVKSKKVLAEENLDKQLEDIDKNIDVIYTELGVPNDAVSIDVLMFRYKIKDDEIKPYTGMQNSPYLNFEVKAYTDGKYFHLADTSDVYSFALDELRGITMVNKRITAASWNKEEHPRKGDYKQYKISLTDNGGLFVSYKPYYILECEHNGEKFGIYFPCYEINTLERLTGLKVKAEIEE